MYSLIIPVYRNAESLPALLNVLENMNKTLEHQLQVVFVVDGSPDLSYAILKEHLPKVGFTSKLLLLSRNFGSYAAIRAGLEVSNGEYFAVMAADLQEPPELICEIFQSLKTEDVDVVFGIRNNRKDPLIQKTFSNLYWFLYKKIVLKDIPPGGIDIFGSNLAFRNELLKLNELNSSLIGLAFWLGFKRKMIGYDRRERQYGKSAWSLSKKLKYAMDSSFAFSDLPIKLLYIIGMLGISLSIIAGISVIVAKMFGLIPVPGYTATVIIIVFFAALNSMGLGIIGSYVWRAFENTKSRPHSVVMNAFEFN